MAMTITYDDAPSTGKRKGTQMVGSNLVFYSGTWDANTTATGTIDLTSTTNVPVAAVTVMSAIVWNEEVVSECPTWKKDVDGAGAAAAGKIGILAVADNANNTGFWEAWCVI